MRWVLALTFSCWPTGNRVVRILQVHNFYQQPGGEDQVYLAEFDLLQRHGDIVEQHSVHNDSITGESKVKVALQTIWNHDSYARFQKAIERFRPDVIHCHNTFPIVSPAIYYAAHRAGVPVAQTVQNYRLICPAATLLREGRICEDCVGHSVPYPGVVHNCYRGSRLASATVAAMLTTHRLAGTWNTKVQRYIAPTGFVRSKLIEGGLPAARVVVKPNFLATDPGIGSGEGKYALFVGRLSPEKGLATLLRAWQKIPDIPLRIVGDGPLREFVAAEAGKLPNVSAVGFKARPEVLQFVKNAALLIVPSEWYEGFPMTVVEAMGCGTPVVASRLGSLAEVIEDGVNGAHFEPRNSDGLALQVRRFLSNPAVLRDMRQTVRQRYEERYSAEQNYPQLRRIYEAMSGADA